MYHRWTISPLWTAPGPATDRLSAMFHVKHHSNRARHARFAVLLALTFILGCGANRGAAPAVVGASDTSPLEPAARGNPLFAWQVEGPRGRLVIAGSVHMGKANGPKIDASLWRAFEESDSLVVEFDVLSMDPVEAQVAMLAMGTLPEGTTLQSLVTPEAWRVFVERLGGASPLANSFSNMKPVLALTTVETFEAMANGYAPEYGIDQQFLLRAHERGLPVHSLESPELQSELIYGMDLDDQILLFNEAMLDGDREADPIDALVQAFSAGDSQAMLKEVENESGHSKASQRLTQRILYDRNQTWVEQFDLWLNEEEARFVVVGAAHLVGPKGVIALLQARGFQARQLHAPEP